MFIAGIIVVISCVVLFFIGKSNWMKLLVSVIVIAVGVMFINEGKDQHKADQVADNTTNQFSSQYDDKYLGSENSSNVPDEYATSKDTNESSQSNSSGKSNSNNHGSSHQTAGLKSKYLKRLDDIQTKVDNMGSNDQTTIDMKYTASDIYKLWDDELNVIYQEIRSHMSESQREVLKQEERAWLKYRDETAEEDAYEFRGGTMEGLERLGSLGESTRKRCYELVNKYMN
ncbi:lysozyme inhibitor LprI family protein [Intestinibacter sp.]